MSTVDRKLSAKAETTSTTGGYIHVILPSGASFISRKLSIENLIKANNADRLYPLVFDNGDLTSGTLANGNTSDGYLTVNHNKGTETIQLVVKDPNNTIYDGYTPVIVDDDTIQLDFSGAIDAGNWKLELFAYLT